MNDGPDVGKGVRGDLDEIARETRAMKAEIHLELHAARKETGAALREAMAEIREALREVWSSPPAADSPAAGPVPRLTRAERKELTRELLFDAAIEVFARKGYNGASLDDVAEAAGFTKGAVYSNFTRKSDLFRALLERESRRRGEGLAEVIAAVPLALLPEVAGEWLRRPDNEQRDRDTLDLEFLLAAVRDPSLRPAMGQSRQALARVLEEKLAKAPAGAFDGDGLARLIVALSVGLLADRYLDPEGGQAELMARAIRTLLGPALASDHPAQRPERPARDDPGAPGGAAG
jgi:AcrR family transcriptional regulator